MIQKNREQREKIIENKDYVRIGSKHQGVYILKTEIVYIEACKGYAWIYLKNGLRKLSSKSIGTYETLFSEDNFMRIHRSYLINLLYLKLLEPSYRLAYLKGEIVLPISHRKNRFILKMMDDKDADTPFKMAM